MKKKVKREISIRSAFGQIRTNLFDAFRESQFVLFLLLLLLMKAILKLILQTPAYPSVHPTVHVVAHVLEIMF